MRVNKCTVKWREGGGRRKGTEEEWIMAGCMEGWMDAWVKDRYMMQDINFEPRPAY